MDLSGQVDVTVYTTSGESCFIEKMDNYSATGQDVVIWKEERGTRG